MAGVPPAQPFDDFHHLLSVPWPPAQARDRVRRRADAVQHVVVDGERLGEVRLHDQHGEAKLADAEFDQAMLEREEFTRAVRGLAERDDARVADHGAQRLEVRAAAARLGGRERDRGGANPVDDVGRRAQKKPSDSQPVPAAKLALTLRAGMSTTCTEPSPWQATKRSSPRKAMSMGWLPISIAVCSRNEGSTRLTMLLLRLVTPIRLLSGAWRG